MKGVNRRIEISHDEFTFSLNVLTCNYSRLIVLWRAELVSKTSE